MEPTSSPDNARQSRGLARFWPVHGAPAPVQRQSDEDAGAAADQTPGNAAPGNAAPGDATPAGSPPASHSASEQAAAAARLAAGPTGGNPALTSDTQMVALGSRRGFDSAPNVPRAWTGAVESGRTGDATPRHGGAPIPNGPPPATGTAPPAPRPPFAPVPPSPFGPAAAGPPAAASGAPSPFAPAGPVKPGSAEGGVQAIPLGAAADGDSSRSRGPADGDSSRSRGTAEGESSGSRGTAEGESSGSRGSAAMSAAGRRRSVQDAESPAGGEAAGAADGARAGGTAPDAERSDARPAGAGAGESAQRNTDTGPGGVDASESPTAAGHGPGRAEGNGRQVPAPGGSATGWASVPTSGVPTVSGGSGASGSAVIPGRSGGPAGPGDGRGGFGTPGEPTIPAANAPAASAAGDRTDNGRADNGRADGRAAVDGFSPSGPAHAGSLAPTGGVGASGTAQPRPATGMTAQPGPVGGMTAQPGRVAGEAAQPASATSGTTERNTQPGSGRPDQRRIGAGGDTVPPGVNGAIKPGTGRAEVTDAGPRRGGDDHPRADRASDGRDHTGFAAPAGRRSVSLEDVEAMPRAGRRAAAETGPAENGAAENGAAETGRADTPLRPGDVRQTQIAFWDDEAVAHFRGEWHEVKAEFVDDPVAALTRAHDLLTDAVNELTESLLAERDELDPLRGRSNPDTESMRMAMRGYREFLDRILAL